MSLFQGLLNTLKVKFILIVLHKARSSLYCFRPCHPTPLRPPKQALWFTDVDFLFFPEIHHALSSLDFREGVYCLLCLVHFLQVLLGLIQLILYFSPYMLHFLGSLPDRHSRIKHPLLVTN